MSFWIKRDSSRARRSFRLWGLRVRRTGLALVGMTLAGAIVFAGWHNGAFSKTAVWISQKSVQTLAAAGFRVGNILVTGRERTPQQDILARLDIQQGMPLFAVDIKAAQERLSGISWVDAVTVSRRLPDTVVVRLQERVPAALWQYRQKIAVVDDAGHVLTTAETGAYRDLPLVVGEDAVKHVRDLKDLLSAEPVIAAEITSASRVGKRRWDLSLKNGMTVRLPEHDAELALRTLARAAQEQGLFDKAIDTVDLRIAGEIVVDPSVPEQDKNKKDKS